MTALMADTEIIEEIQRYPLMKGVLVSYSSLDLKRYQLLAGIPT